MEVLARTLAELLVTAGGGSEEQMATCSYALLYLMVVAANVAAVLLLGVVTGTLPATLAVAVSASLLRTFSGGAHFSSPARCLVMSSLITVALGWLSTRIQLTTMPSLAAAIAVAYIVMRYAPVDSPAKPIPESQRGRFRIASFIVVVLIGLGSLALQSEMAHVVRAGLLGMVWQAVSLTPAGRRVFQFLDTQLMRLA